MVQEELSIVTAVPVVTLTKAKGYSANFVEVRANDSAENLSIHYEADVEMGGVPTVQEQLLVAVLAGVNPQWLSERPLDEKVPITFEGVSSLPRILGSSSNIAVTSHGHDTVHMGTVDPDTGLNRLRIWLRDEADDLLGSVVLSKGQVTSMLAALLAIYPRLREE